MVPPFSIVGIGYFSEEYATGRSKSIWSTSNGQPDAETRW